MSAPDLSDALVFDLEGHSAAEWIEGHTPESFVRLAGWGRADIGAPVELGGLAELRAAIGDAKLLVPHNGISSDLMWLGYSRPELLQLARDRKVLDTFVTCPLFDQPEEYDDAQGKHVKVTDWLGRADVERLSKYYRLDNLASNYSDGRYGKTGDVTELAERLGDPDACCKYGSIPVDDPDYRRYQAGDVEATRVPLWVTMQEVGQPGKVDWPYVWAEHHRAAFCAVVARNGFRVDVELAQRRHEADRERSRQVVERYAEKYGLSLLKADGKPSTKPFATKGGKELLGRLLREHGYALSELTKTKSRNPQPSLGGKALRELAEAHPDDEWLDGFAADVELVGSDRGIYKTAYENVRADGRAHPRILTLQRSGRASLTRPGMTVYGKKNGKHRERDVFLPDVIGSDGAYERDLHALVAFDLAQVDARACAVLSQDDAYLDLFGIGPDGKPVDAHTLVAVSIWGAPTVLATEASRHHYRNLGKPMHHASNYGIGVEKMAKTARVPEEIARQFQDGFRLAYPKLDAWKEATRAEALDTGYVDNGWGRMMKVDPDRAYTQAPALKGQGCARDMLFGAPDLGGLLKLDDSVACMVKTLVHDEVVLSIPLGVIEDVCNHVKECLTYEWAPPWASRPVSITCDMSPWGLTWGECYDEE